jgi:hypothetical protein
MGFILHLPCPFVNAAMCGPAAVLFSAPVFSPRRVSGLQTRHISPCFYPKNMIK